MTDWTDDELVQLTDYLLDGDPELDTELLDAPGQDFLDQADVASGGVCRVCGCTEAMACELGCVWVEEDLCSRCYHEGNR